MKNKPVVYCIPGLGLDHRVFQKLDLPSFKVKYLDFIEPKKKETISDYAARLAEQIIEDDFCLLGMSLGGVLSVEISRIRQVKQLFLLSTIKNKAEMPKFLQYIDKLPTRNKTASKIAIDATVAFKPYYDKSDDEGNKLFDEMIHTASPEILAWGIEQIASWNFEADLNSSFYHLHGTADLIFPIKNINQAETVKGATHYMVYNDAKEVSKRIEARINLLASNT